MKIQVLGCGSAFSTRNFNTSFLLEDTDGFGKPRRLLVDAGFQTGAAMARAGLNVMDIDDIYVSHLHADHAGYLEALGFQRYDWRNMPRSSMYTLSKSGVINLGESDYAPNLYIADDLARDLWDTVLGGMHAVSGMDCKLETFFYIKPVGRALAATWCGWELSTVRHTHVKGEYNAVQSYGLLMRRKADGKQIYFTTDEAYCLGDDAYAADIIFQDVECMGLDIHNKAMRFGSGVHPNFAQLAGWTDGNGVPRAARARTWLVHYPDFVSEDKDMEGNTCHWQNLARSEGFNGFAHVGQCFSI